MRLPISENRRLMEAKKRQQEKIDRQVADFLAKGGKIKKVEENATADPRWVAEKRDHSNHWNIVC